MNCGPFNYQQPFPRFFVPGLSSPNHVILHHTFMSQRDLYYLQLFTWPTLTENYAFYSISQLYVFLCHAALCH